MKPCATRSCTLSLSLSLSLSLGLCLSLPVLPGCGGDDASGGPSGVAGAKDPFGGPTPTAVFGYSFSGTDGKTKPYLGKTEGTKEVNGVTYRVAQVMPDNEDGYNHRMEVYINHVPGRTIEFGGGTLYWDGSGVQPKGEPFVSGIPETPISGDLNPPVGVPQTVRVKGTAYIGDPTNPTNAHALDVEATYTLTDDDASVETSIGMVHGCKHFTGGGTFVGVDIHLEAWYHPQYGLVKFKTDYPAPNGIGMDLTEITDLGAVKEGMAAIKGMKVLTQADPTLEVSTFDVNQDFDADKDQHAKMLLELRYVDETKAKQTNVPEFVYGNIEFGTTWGYFPHQLVASPISLFHPEENGKGYTFFVAYVDQAAKNQQTNGISYHVKATLPDYMYGSPMRATARIVYHLWHPATP